MIEQNSKREHLLSAATMLTTIDVEVEELCTNTAARIPIIRSATGLERILLDAKASPVVFPPSNRKALLRKSKEKDDLAGKQGDTFNFF